MTATSAAFTQLLSVGLVWISVHCAGMCGPILIGFDVAGVSQGRSAGRGALSLLTYQAGRALTYAILGGTVGLVGAGLSRALRHTGGYLTLALGVAMLLTALTRARPAAGSPGTPSLGDRLAAALPRLARPLLRAAGTSTDLRNFTLGAIMGLMPCMISLWALGLAATTGNPLHGAALMVTLAAMTTPMLLGVTLLPRVVGDRLRGFGRVAPTVLMGLSGVWLLLAGSAGLGVIHHAHFGFSAFGDTWAIMFW